MLASRCFFDARCPALLSGWQRHSPNQAVTCVAHWIERVGSARQRLDIDGSGCLNEGERRHANMSRCGRGRSPTTAKDTVLPMKHGKSCALLGVGETWTQKDLGVLIPGSTFFNLCNQLSNRHSFQNGFYAWKCVIEHTTKSDKLQDSSDQVGLCCDWMSLVALALKRTT